MAAETILVVEDDVVLLEGLRDMLEIAGYRVLTAIGGPAGLVAVREAQPDLIVSDVAMPGMDGYEFYQAVRKLEGGTAIPFIFLSARGEKYDVRLGKRMGADDYITKPFEEEDLLVAISSRLRRHRELAAAQREELDALKRSIFTTLGHELRTPLTHLVTYADLLEETGPLLEMADFDQLMRGLRAGLTRLSRLVDDFALLVALRTGQAEATFESRCRRVEDVPGLLAATLNAFRERAAERELTLEIDCPAELPAIDADVEYLHDALGRLVDNAIKFTPAAGEPVRLSAATAGQDLRIAVIDAGIGIREDDLIRLFDVFGQIDRDQMEQQGAGNGLAICRAIVELHGGRLSARSTPGAGSTFTVHLPLAVAAAHD